MSDCIGPGWSSPPGPALRDLEKSGRDFEIARAFSGSGRLFPLRPAEIARRHALLRAESAIEGRQAGEAGLQRDRGDRRRRLAGIGQARLHGRQPVAVEIAGEVPPAQTPIDERAELVFRRADLLGQKRDGQAGLEPGALFRHRLLQPRQQRLLDRAESGIGFRRGFRRPGRPGMERLAAQLRQRQQRPARAEGGEDRAEERARPGLVQAEAFQQQDDRARAEDRSGEEKAQGLDEIFVNKTKLSFSLVAQPEYLIPIGFIAFLIIMIIFFKKKFKK